MIQYMLIFLLSFSPLIGCSRVFLNDSAAKLVIRSMDLDRYDDAKVTINPRGFKRDGGAENALTWQAKYGSVTTTVFGNGTADGMNEKGLAGHLHYLDGAKYQCSNNVPQIGIHLWLQYFLDTCANVQEVVNIAATFQVANLNIAGDFWPLFAVLEDSSGETAILEYIDGKLHIHHGGNYNVATNDPFYGDHLQNLKRYTPFGGNLAIPIEQDSTCRFVRVAAFLEHSQTNSTWDKILKIIQIIEKQPGSGWQTLWLTVCDLQNQQYFFLRTTDRKAFSIDLKKIDFAPDNPIWHMNPYDTRFIGDISSYVRCSLLRLKNRNAE